MSPLLSLPTELRLQIYTHIYASPSTYLTLHQHAPPSARFFIHDAHDPQCELRSSTALTQTCRTIYRETRDLLWTLNTLLTFRPYLLSPFYPSHSHAYAPTGAAARFYTVDALSPSPSSVPSPTPSTLPIPSIPTLLTTIHRWAELNLPNAHLTAPRGGLRFSSGAVEGAELYFRETDAGALVLEGEEAVGWIRGKRGTGKRERWRRVRWEVREWWWGVWT